MFEVKRKIWDSEFFGFEVGEILIDSKFNIEDFKNDSTNYKLIYLYSNNEVIDLNSNFKSSRVESERTISVLEKIEFSSKIEKAGIVDLNSDKLKDLALQSGEFSRFFNDGNFKNQEFEKLYLEWINKSIKNIHEIDTFLYKENDEIAGFITLEKGPEVNTIGLLGVDKKYRGMGIGNSLVEFCIYESQKSGIKKLKVVTQGENLPALSLYKKQNFEIINFTYIYHLWNI